jgi:hypothetical protein
MNKIDKNKMPNKGIFQLELFLIIRYLAYEDALSLALTCKYFFEIIYNITLKYKSLVNTTCHSLFNKNKSIIWSCAVKEYSDNMECLLLTRQTQFEYVECRPNQHAIRNLSNGYNGAKFLPYEYSTTFHVGTYPSIGNNYIRIELYSKPGNYICEVYSKENGKEKREGKWIKISNSYNELYLFAELNGIEMRIGINKCKSYSPPCRNHYSKSCIDIIRSFYKIKLKTRENPSS